MGLEDLKCAVKRDTVKNKSCFISIKFTIPLLLGIILGLTVGGCNLIG